jgi:hypothetical protein
MRRMAISFATAKASRPRLADKHRQVTRRSS